MSTILVRTLLKTPNLSKFFLVKSHWPIDHLFKSQMLKIWTNLLTTLTSHACTSKSHHHDPQHSRTLFRYPIQKFHFFFMCCNTETHWWIPHMGKLMIVPFLSSFWHIKILTTVIILNMKEKIYLFLRINLVLQNCMVLVQYAREACIWMSYTDDDNFA